MTIRSLATTAEFDAAKSASFEQPVVLFKHSRLCSLSSLAQREIEKLTASDDPPVYRVVVQDSRALSNEIEHEFGIRHESPQYILLSGGKPFEYASHRRVTAAEIREKIYEKVRGQNEGTQQHVGR